MSLQITSLNSGSNGNCYYIGNAHEAVLVDVGLTCKEMERRMIRLGLPLERIKAIFISHEHIDHIRGMEVIAGKYQLPVYITHPTLQNSRMKLPEHLVRPFTAYEAVHIGGLAVTAFPKLHDAVDAHSFIVSGNEVTIGVFTDIGTPCEHLVRNFRQCHAAFLEANYDEHMLETGGYPYHLKRRIRGGHGHLSNRQAMELLATHRPDFMSHVLLAHLSKNNNSPELVYGLFSSMTDDLNVIIASRDRETAVYEVHSYGKPEPVAPYKVPVRAVQASLF